MTYLATVLMPLMNLINPTMSLGTRVIEGLNSRVLTWKSEMEMWGLPVPTTFTATSTPIKEKLELLLAGKPS